MKGKGRRVEEERGVKRGRPRGAEDRRQNERRDRMVWRERYEGEKKTGGSVVKERGRERESQRVHCLPLRPRQTIHRQDNCFQSS